MRRIVLAVFLSLIAPVAFAGQPTEAQIDRLLELSRARALVDGMLEQVSASQRGMMDQMLAGQAPTPAQRAKLDRMLVVMDKRMREMLAWEKMRPLYQRVYAATFEAEDVDAMIAFYSTPSGQRVIDRMPVLMQHTMQEVQAMIVPMMQQFQQDIAAEVAAERADESGAGDVAK